MANVDDARKWVTDIQDFLDPLSTGTNGLGMRANALKRQIPKVLQVFDYYDLIPLKSDYEFEGCPVCGATTSQNCVIPSTYRLELTDMVHRKRLKEKVIPVNTDYGTERRWNRNVSRERFLGCYGDYDIYYDDGRGFSDYIPPNVILVYGNGSSDFYSRSNSFKEDDPRYQPLEDAFQEAYRRAKSVDPHFFVYEPPYK